MSALIRAGALDGYEDLMTSLGADPLPLLKRHRIEPEDLANPETLVSLPDLMRLLEDSASATNCPHIGLRLVASQGTETVGLLSAILLGAQSFIQAIEDASRYLFLHSPAMEFVVERPSPLFPDCVSCRIGFRQPEYVLQRQSVDAALGLAWRIIQLLTAGNVPLVGVALPHSPMGNPGFYESFFGAPVLFEQPYASLHFDEKVESLSLEPINPMLRSMALDYVAKTTSHPTATWTDRVRQTITLTLGANSGSKQNIARLLNIHPRTLQRRLDAEGSCYDSIRNEVLKSTVMPYLCETDLPIAQIADILGYAGQAALARSCQRWFGASPTQIRNGGGRNTTEATKPH